MGVDKKIKLGLVIFSCLFGFCRFSFAQDWVQIGMPANYWYAVASSADGSKMAIEVHVLLGASDLAQVRPEFVEIKSQLYRAFRTT